MGNIHISISAESLLNLFGFKITNSMLTSLGISAGLIVVSMLVKKIFSQPQKIPRGWQNFFELVVETVEGFVYSVVKDKDKTEAFTPFFLGFFIVILVNNWFGLMPGVGTLMVKDPHPAEALEYQQTEFDAETNADKETDHHESQSQTLSNIHQEENHIDADKKTDSHQADSHSLVPALRPGSADLNGTIALALMSVISIQYMGYKFQGLRYFRKFVDPSGPVQFFIGLLEIFSEIAKILSFSFRLFGNIFAGEVLLTVIFALLPVGGPMPFYVLELFVGFVQALVFSMLTLVFYNMATQHH